MSRAVPADCTFGFLYVALHAGCTAQGTATTTPYARAPVPVGDPGTAWGDEGGASFSSEAEYPDLDALPFRLALLWKSRSSLVTVPLLGLLAKRALAFRPPVAGRPLLTVGALADPRQSVNGLTEASERFRHASLSPAVVDSLENCSKGMRACPCCCPRCRLWDIIG